jgi:transcriptional regulator with XRE-family HTH domain
MKITKRDQKKVERIFGDIAEYRRGRNENQTEFWQRFGVGQSSGSRYEAGKEIPMSTRMLLILHALEVLDDSLLSAVSKLGDS